MQLAAELSQFAVLEERVARLELTVATLQQRLDTLGQIEGQLEELVAHLQQEAATLAQAEGQTERRLKAVEHELIESRTDHEDF